MKPLSYITERLPLKVSDEDDLGDDYVGDDGYDHHGDVFLLFISNTLKLSLLPLSTRLN